MADDAIGSGTDSSRPYAAEWGLWTKRLAAIILLLGLILVIFLARHVLGMIIVGLILTYVLSFPVHFVKTRLRLPHAVATIVVFILYLVVLGLVSYGLVMPMSHMVGGFVTEMLQKVETYLSSQSNNINQWLLNKAQSMVGTLSSTLGSVLGAAGAVSETFTGLVVANLLALMILFQLPAAGKWIDSQIPDRYRREYSILVGRLSHMWKGYFVATVILACSIGVLNGIQMAVLGISGALMVGIISGIAGLVPVLGGLVSVVVIGVVALVQGSNSLHMDHLTVALLAVGINVVFQALVWNVGHPKLAGTAVSVPMALILVGVVVGTAFGGILGAFLAAPVLGGLREVIGYVVKKIRGGDPYPDIP